MRLLKESSCVGSASALGLALALLVAAVASPAQQSAPSEPATTRTYESIVGRRPRPVGFVARPVLLAGAGALVAVAGGAVSASPDGGEHWERRGSLPGPSPVPEAAVAAAARADGVWWCLCRSGRVYESRDGGWNWTATDDLAGVGRDPGRSVACGALAGDGTGWAALDGPMGTIVAAEGGRWRRVDALRAVVTSGWRDAEGLLLLAGSDVMRWGTDARFSRVASLRGAALNGVVFADAERGWIAADQGLVLETRDGGKTWLSRPVAGTSTLEAIGAAGAALWAVGTDGADGVLYVSTDDGRVWRRMLAAAPPLAAPIAVAGTWVAVDGAGGVWRAGALDGAWRRVGSLTRGKKGSGKGRRS